LGKIFRATNWILYMATWNILWIFGDHSVHFVFIWYIFPVLVSCTEKNLATLAGRALSVARRQFVLLHKILASFH
jgi:hypothetical protein